MVPDELAFCLAKNLADQEEVLAVVESRPAQAATGPSGSSNADLVSHIK